VSETYYIVKTPKHVNKCIVFIRILLCCVKVYTYITLLCEVADIYNHIHDMTHQYNLM
jgi:hypothetical protein